MRISDWSSDVCSSDLSDSSQSFPLLKSFSACSDKVDMEALIATAQYKLYYIDAGGATVEVSDRSEEHTSELQSLMRISYAVFCLKKKKHKKLNYNTHNRQKQTQHARPHILKHS